LRRGVKNVDHRTFPVGFISTHRPGLLASAVAAMLIARFLGAAFERADA
jgi:hypothetical protein